MIINIVKIFFFLLYPCRSREQFAMDRLVQLACLKQLVRKNIEYLCLIIFVISFTVLYSCKCVLQSFSCFSLLVKVDVNDLPGIVCFFPLQTRAFIIS